MEIVHVGWAGYEGGWYVFGVECRYNVRQNVYTCNDMLGRVSCGMRLVWIFKGVWYGGCGSSGRSDFYVG